MEPSAPQKQYLIVDAHQDMAWNIRTFERDYTRAAEETRQRERRAQAPRLNGDTLLGWPDYQAGRVGVIFSTLFAAPARRQISEWDIETYQDIAEAHLIYSRQLDVYHRLVEAHPDKFQMLHTQADLTALLTAWEDVGDAPLPEEPADHDPAEPPQLSGPPVGLVALMEGAEGIRSVDELGMWWTRGVRIIGPAWAGTRFCGGTGEPGPLTKEGYQLLEGMVEYGFMLDVSHMDEKAVRQSIDFFPGTMIASHANALALLKGMESNRFLSDQVIAGLIERGAVIGIVPFGRFLVPGWGPQDGRQAVSLEHVAAQIDYICQFAGDARHVGIGSDFDGGFGLQSVPHELDTIADLQKLAPLLAQKGYTDEDIAGVMGQNWLRILVENLPESV